MTTSFRSWSHHGLEFGDLQFGCDVFAIAAWKMFDSVSVYVSSCSWLGYGEFRKASRGSLWASSSSSFTFIQSSALTFLRLNLMSRGFSISCDSWSMVNFIALWLESRARWVSMAQSLKVSLSVASWLVNDRSITDSLSPSRQARWVISPLGLRRERPCRVVQSTMSSVSWSC